MANYLALSLKIIALTLLVSQQLHAESLKRFSNYESNLNSCKSTEKLLEEHPNFSLPSMDSCEHIAHECSITNPVRIDSLLKSSGLYSECMMAGLKLKPSSKQDAESHAFNLIRENRDADATLYFVPIGDVSNQFMVDIVDYYKNILDIKVSVAPRVRLNPSAYDNKRDQYKTTPLIEDFAQRFEDYSNTEKPTYIGITHSDVYLESREEWRFVFGSYISYVSGSRENSSDAVISTARIDFGSLEDRNELVRTSSNFRKMISRYIAELHYKKERNDDPESILYRSILGLDDLDRIKEESIKTDVLGLKISKE